MYGGNRPPFRPNRGKQWPPPPPPPPPHQQFPFNHNPYFILPDPNLLLQYNNNNTTAFLPQQNPNFPIQNPNFSQPHQSRAPAPPPQQKPATSSAQKLPQRKVNRGRREIIERADKEAEKAWKGALEAGETISSLKVSMAVLAALQSDSWEALGVRVQEVPSLHRLIVTEGKINAFIHCFVAVRRITTLYDLEVSISENEGISKFEELDLGPLLRHPLVLHYFSMHSNATEVIKITSEDIVNHLSEFMDSCERKEINVDELLNFIAKKESITSKEMLGVRIQSLGMHISFIREAKGSEHVTLKRCREKLLKKLDSEKRNAPISLSEKKDMEKRMFAIRQRVESFSSQHMDFSGKHIRFVSSSSDDEESDDGDEEGVMTSDAVGNQFRPSPQCVSSSNQKSCCPYPSEIEEKSRLGLISEMGGQASPANVNSSIQKNELRSGKKRKRAAASSLISKFLKADTGNPGTDKKVCMTEETTDSHKIQASCSSNSLRVFISTWKETCKEYSPDKALRKMLRFYKQQSFKHRTKFKKQLLSSYPCAELLNIAVNSIKLGMWDSIYDTFQDITQHESTNVVPINDTKYESIDVEPDKESIGVEPDEKSIPILLEHRVQRTQRVTVEEIIGKVTGYYDLNNEFLTSDKSCMEEKLISWRKLCHCEFWLAEQFGVKEFESLGYGGFLIFLQKHASVLPTEVQNLLASCAGGKFPLEVSMLHLHLSALLSQASNSIWENQKITQRMISLLLERQFPQLGFKVTDNGSLEHTPTLGKRDTISKCLIFSATLSGSWNALPDNEDSGLVSCRVTTYGDQKFSFDPVSSKEAIEVLLKAPMLSDLSLWSHWEVTFAPTLGPLVGWLLSEVNDKELLCLMTKDGRVVRIDQSASVDSFLEAALRGSSFQTAVQLLSLFSIAGGEKHVTTSLLKCYAERAIEAIVKNHVENMKVEASENYLSRKNLMEGHLVSSAVSRYFLDCLGYVPPEFWLFAADVLLYGMQSTMEDTHLAILNECKLKERLMLHDIGLGMGIRDWIGDYQKFRCTGGADLFCAFESEASCLKAVRSDAYNKSDNFCCANSETTVSPRKDAHISDCSGISHLIDNAVLSDGIPKSCNEQLSDLNCEEAAQFIDSIRREEFGLDPDISSTESDMLKKQHARLGRALHCLSQELYSQDSHFLLELVQNADDNMYPGNVEPTLTFILQESGVIVLNNEQGFSPHNIRALCDVGNSTKKGFGSGYIGHKGIGFKSVFRVTDAPEIHSNGFHVKFDIGGGQVGFVVPTVIPPCNVDLFFRLASQGSDQIDSRCWRTCIVLPFRSKMSEETAIRMFSDLHPSLLLFLHRLQCIIFRNMINDSIVVMRKETLEDGIVKVSCGNKSITWLVTSQQLQAHATRPDIQTTEISLAFTLEKLDNGDFCPRPEQQQPVFSFLPLRTYGMKFILQGDFILPSSREEVDKNNPWNEWLLTKFPGLFVNALGTFLALSCFKESPGRAVTAYMSFVPLVGEVHGFFSGLPKAIILELRKMSCLPLEGKCGRMVPPCNVLRGWNEQSLKILQDDLLHEHLGLGFLDKSVVLSDSLSRALGVVQYGPDILIKFMTALSRKENGIKSMGLGWLSSWLDALYMMLLSGELVLEDNLRCVPFVPLADGTYSSVDTGTIWLHYDALNTGSDGALRLEAFPKLFAKLRIVDPGLLAATVDNMSVSNIVRMLNRIGVQQLSAHEIVKVHILPAISDDTAANWDDGLMADYLCFIMIHLQSSCSYCCAERNHMISELKNKAYILTNYGYKRLAEMPLHLNGEFGNPIDINKIINGAGIRWHEVAVTYLKHPANNLLSNAQTKWREFLLEIGVTDFVKVVQVDRSPVELFNTVLRTMTLDSDVIALESVAKDRESQEMVQLLSLLSRSGDRECCKYLLEVLDKLWDDNLGEKALGRLHLKSSGDVRPFRSSFLSSICDIEWVVSSNDMKLHRPKDLFYDCDAVRSMLGPCAPYALPKVKSKKLLSDVGFKTKVNLTDLLEIFDTWTKSETIFKASIAQMSKLYKFVHDEMAVSKTKVSEIFNSKPFIFVPFKSSWPEDQVPGAFLSPKEVYWHDPTGLLSQIKVTHSHQANVTQQPFSSTLCNVYPSLHDFFINECGVCEIPSCHQYIDILQQLSVYAPPSQSAAMVFQILLKWAVEMKSGVLNTESITHLKERLAQLECKVLPTVQDKWVSLHPSYGLVCWCDDTKLMKEFNQPNGIVFLNFGNLKEEEQLMLQTKVSPLLKHLGIPAFSEITTREAIYYGLVNSSFKASVINWALPYAQRYIHKVHPTRYSQLQESGFDNPMRLQVRVVTQLFYRNVMKVCGTASTMRHECACLLKGNTFYTIEESDSHALFLELSRLFFENNPDLHLANFLHMITTMAESGSTEEQTEFFIAYSQKVPKLPDEERIWCLLSDLPMFQDDPSLQVEVGSVSLDEQKTPKTKRNAGTRAVTNWNWPPANWKTAPGFVNSNCLKTQGVIDSNHSHPSCSKELQDDVEESVTERDCHLPIEIGAEWTTEDATAALISTDNAPKENTFDNVCVLFPMVDIAIKSTYMNLLSGAPDPASSAFSWRSQLQTGTANATQALVTGRLGESVVFKYLIEKYGHGVVTWVNEDSESGLPYDMVIGENENSTQFVEVKTTMSARKDWFIISTREWQFAVEKGDSFSILHVVLSKDNIASVTTFRNPVKQCQQRKLQLVMMMPRQQNSISS